MAKFYYTQIKLGNMTIDEVPTRWRASVDKMLKAEQGEGQVCMQHKRIPYAEFYNYDRLEKAAHDLHWEETEENEILLINLHNQLVWHLYRFDKDPRADAILYAVIEAILGEKAADITDVPWELRCVWKGGKKANVFE